MVGVMFLVIGSDYCSDDCDIFWCGVYGLCIVVGVVCLVVVIFDVVVEG